MKVSNRNIKYHIDAHHHGLYVKEARLRQGYKLAEVANNICDTSYLSKIESGRLIPSPEIFEKISERLNLEFPPEERLCPMDVFKDAMYEENMAIIDEHMSKNECHHYERQLIEFFRAVLDDVRDVARKIKAHVDQFQSHLSAKEESIYLLFVGLYSLKRYKWKEAEHAFKQALALAAVTKEKDPYLLMTLGQYYFKVGKMCLGFSYMEDAIVEFKRVFARKWVFHCEIMLCLEYLQVGNVTAVKDKLDMIKRLIEPGEKDLKKNIYYTLVAAVYEHEQKFILADDYYERSVAFVDGKRDERALIAQIAYLYRRQNYENMLKLVYTIDQTTVSELTRLMIDFYAYKATDPLSGDFEAFLRKDAIVYADKTLDYRHMDLFTKELSSYHRHKMSHRKVAEAYYRWEQFCLTLESVERI